MEYFSIEISVLVRLIIAALFGGIIGLERGGSRHEAGLRTHIVLCLGSATVMVVSEILAEQYGGDVMRMGSQVVSGIGFLGAGSIIVHGNRVKGITTAAGLWATACIGLAVGSAQYMLALTVIVLMLLAMWGLRPLASKIQSSSTRLMIRIELTERTAIREIMQKFLDESIQINSVTLEEHGETISAIMELQSQKDSGFDKLLGELIILEGVKEFTVM